LVRVKDQTGEDLEKDREELRRLGKTRSGRQDSIQREGRAWLERSVLTLVGGQEATLVG
jgi:hypothetical protein